MSTEEQGRGPAGESRKSGPLVAVVRWMENLSEEAYAYLLLTPGFFILLLMAFWPLGSAFRMSFFADQVVGTGRLGGFAGLENYVRLLTDTNALAPATFLDPSFQVPLLEQALFMTLLFAILSVVGETILGFLYAMLMKAEYRGRRAVRVLIIIPWAIPIVIQGMIFFLLFNNSVGIAGIWLSEIGMFTRNPLSTPENALLVVMVADVWKQTPFIALLVLAGLQSIDRDLYEVARVSGATRWERFKTVTFPLVLPTLLVAMLFRSIGAMKIYGTIVPIAGCNTVPSLSCVVVSTFNSRLYGTSTAVAVLMAVIIGSLMMFYIIPYARTEGGV